MVHASVPLELLLKLLCACAPNLIMKGSVQHVHVMLFGHDLIGLATMHH